jgi:hypothetical protein
MQMPIETLPPAAKTSSEELDIGQMVCLEFSTPSGRPARLFGHLAEATAKHLLIEGITGATARPMLEDIVNVSTMVGRNVRSAETRVLRIVEPGATRIALRRPPALTAQTNRRRHPRIDLAVQAKCVDLEDPTLRWFEGETVDISLGGLQIRTALQPGVETGHRMLVNLLLRDQAVPLICEVRAIRNHPRDGGLVRYGVEIIAITPLDRLVVGQLTSHD